MNIQNVNINLPALLEQKQALLRAMNAPRTSKADVELLQGLLNLLDYIHDQVDPPMEDRVNAKVRALADTLAKRL